MAWRQPGDKPLSEPMMVRLLTHICVSRPQWVNSSNAVESNTTTHPQPIHDVNSLRPIHAPMYQWTGPALVQVMTCSAVRLYSAIRLFGSILLFRQCRPTAKWKLTEKVKWNFKQNTTMFMQETKMIFQMRCERYCPFCLGLIVFKIIICIRHIHLFLYNCHVVYYTPHLSLTWPYWIFVAFTTSTHFKANKVIQEEYYKLLTSIFTQQHHISWFILTDSSYKKQSNKSRLTID